MEYALTTVMMALIASMLYVVYQPIAYSVFAPLDMPDSKTGALHKDRGLGTKEMLYLPVP